MAGALWLDSTNLYSGGHRESCTDRGRSAKYAQEQENTGLLSNVAMVLYVPGLVVEGTAPFRVPVNHPPTPHWHQDARNCKTAA